MGQLAASHFESLSVLLVEAAQVPSRRTQGLPDEAFARGKVPMTKQEVRAAVLAKLGVQPGELLWDVGRRHRQRQRGAGLGRPRGRVYAVEVTRRPVPSSARTKEKFAVRNLTLVEGTAPAALENLPAPDAVFIGGTKGNLAAVVEAALARNPAARVCISAIALETLSAAVAALTAHGLQAEVCQISVSRAKAAGKLHLLMANNPIFLITRADEAEKSV